MSLYCWRSLAFRMQWCLYLAWVFQLYFAKIHPVLHPSALWSGWNQRSRQKQFLDGDIISLDINFQSILSAELLECGKNLTLNTKARMHGKKEITQPHLGWTKVKSKTGLRFSEAKKIKRGLYMDGLLQHKIYRFWSNRSCQPHDIFSHLFEKDNAKPHSTRITETWLRCESFREPNSSVWSPDLETFAILWNRKYELLKYIFPQKSVYKAQM